MYTKAFDISTVSVFTLVGTRGFSQEWTTGSILDNLTVSAFDTPTVATNATHLSYPYDVLRPHHLVLRFIFNSFNLEYIPSAVSQAFGISCTSFLR
jgi:hypothetical protein